MLLRLHNLDCYLIDLHLRAWQRLEQCRYWYLRLNHWHEQLYGRRNSIGWIRLRDPLWNLDWWSWWHGRLNEVRVDLCWCRGSRVYVWLRLVIVVELCDHLRDNKCRSFDRSEWNRRSQDWSKSMRARIYIWLARILLLFDRPLGFLDNQDFCMINDCELMDRNLSCNLSERIISANDTDTFKAVASQLVGSLRFYLDSKSVEAGLERCFRDGETGNMLTIKLVFRSIL